MCECLSMWFFKFVADIEILILPVNTAPDLCLASQVSVPKDLVAVMSAVRDGQEADPQDNNRVVYRFRQPVSLLFFSVR